MGQRLHFSFASKHYKFSEDWWYAANQPDLELIRTDARNLASLRGSLLGTECDLAKWRLSDDAIPGDSIVEYLPTVTKVGHISNADNPYSSVLVRVECGANVRSLKKMGGLPDTYIEDQALDFGPAWNTRWNAFKAALFAKWAIQSLDKSGGNPEKPVINAVVAAGVATITVTAHGLASGDMIRLRRIKVTGVSPNGVWQIVRLSADAFALQGWPAGDTFNYLQGGLIRKIAYSVPAITAVTIDRPVLIGRGNGSERVKGRARRR